MPDIKAPNTYFTGGSGEDIVKFYLKQWKISCTSIEKSDFGEDILCDIFASSDDGTTNIRTNLSFRTQVKTTEKIDNDGYIRLTKKGFSVSISTALLQLWQKSYFPVIIVIWDLSANKGFWGIPDKYEKELNNTSNDTLTIHIKKENDFCTSGDSIKNYVRDYYAKIFKLEFSKYRCLIYPLSMPSYRLLTAYELYNITEIKSRVDVKGHLADYEPTFLVSYNNLNLGGSLYFIEYLQEATSTDEYISSLKNYILGLKISNKSNEWISFVVSPIEIITTNDDRVISRLTDWTCFSQFKNGLYNDYDFTFSLSDDYFYSEAVRATSGKQNYFVHKSGRYAVEIFARGCYSYASKKDDELRNTIYKHSFCVWDISTCKEPEIEQLIEWCKNKSYNIEFLEEDQGFVVISHSLFFVGKSGVLLPGVITWETFDQINFTSKDFVQQIPWGKLPNESTYISLCEKYFNINSEPITEIITPYEETIQGAALRHDERVIRFICYIETLENNFEQEFQKVSTAMEKELKKKFRDINFVFEPYADLNDIIFEFKPFYYMSTKDAVDIAEVYFLTLLDSLSTFINDSKNMAYYIKYLLDRWLPEGLVSK